MEEVYLLIKEEFDFHTLYGIYDSYIKAEEDRDNLLKYSYIYDKSELRIYRFEINKFYKNNEEIELII